MKSFTKGKVALAAAAMLSIGALLTACAGDTGSGSNGGGTDTSGNDASGGTSDVRMVINNTISSLPVAVADEKGFFEEEGLNVDITISSDISKIPPTLGKQYDIGFGVPPTLILANAQGINIVMVSGNAITTEEKPEYIIMARPDAGIEGPEDLVGKKLGSPTLNGNIHTGTRYWLHQNGVDPDSVEALQVPTPAMVDQLKAGLIDAAEMQYPYIDIAREAGMVDAAYAMSAVNDPTAMSSWQAERSWAESNPETLQKFRAALDKAIQWIQDNDSEARDVLSEFTGLDRDVIGESPLAAFSTEMSEDSVKQWDAPMRAVTNFDAEIDYSTLVVE